MQNWSILIGPWEILIEFFIRLKIRDVTRDISCEIALRLMLLDLTDDKSILVIGQGNGFVPSDNKSLPESMLT